MPITATSGASAVSSSSSATTLTNGRFVGDPQLQAVRRGEVTLSNGASGEAVRKVQSALLDMGFALKPYTSTSGATVGGADGAFGNQTRNALLNFQRHARHLVPGVAVTGTLDQATIRALDRLAPPPGQRAWAAGANPAAPRPYWNGLASKQLRAVVVKDEHRTFLFDNLGKVIGIFSNSHGAPGTPTHTGLKTVTGKLGQTDTEATGRRLWRDAKAFGLRIIDLSWSTGTRSGEELHGTFEANRLGLDVSHGCIRHYNDDILTIFAQLKIGDRVAVVSSINAAELGSPINV